MIRKGRTAGWRRRPVALLGLGLLLAGCSGAGASDETGPVGSGTANGGIESASPEGSTAAVVRLGFFANVTHAPALVGVGEGLFEEELGDTVLETATFNTGTTAAEALFGGAIDMTFIGPNPAINAWSQSGGEAIRIVAGSTSGGASLVVSADIESVEDLAGATLSSPSLGNTQDVALRAWLAEQGLETTVEGGGDVSIMPQENAQTLETFSRGDIDGAWLPEPWATRLIVEGGGHVLVDEAELWPEGRFVTTHLVVATDFLEEYPGTVAAVIRGLVAALDYIAASPEEAQRVTNEQILAITGRALAPETIQGAWENLEFTADPIASSLAESAADAQAVGLLDPVDLDGIYRLDLLNAVLAELGREQVSP